MKKLLGIAALLAFSTTAFAGFQGSQQGGFQQGQVKSQSAVNTVAQAKRAYDDTYVTLRGNITGKVAHEKYTFKDSTGSIRVEIDDDLWGGLTVTPKTKVTLYGKVDHDDGRVEIDVKRISK